MFLVLTKIGKAQKLKNYALWIWLVGRAQVLHGVVDLPEKAKAQENKLLLLLLLLLLLSSSLVTGLFFLVLLLNQR